MYGDVNGSKVAILAKDSFIELFEDYKRLSGESVITQTMSTCSLKEKEPNVVEVGKKIHDLYKMEFK